MSNYIIRLVDKHTRFTSYVGKSKQVFDIKEAKFFQTENEAKSEAKRWYNFYNAELYFAPKIDEDLIAYEKSIRNWEAGNF